MAGNKNEWKRVGECGVDSAQLLVCDPCYITERFSAAQPGEAGGDGAGKPQLDYAGCCSVTLTEAQAGQLHYEPGHSGAGVAVSTGLGDGLYPVYALYHDHPEYGLRPAALMVDFQYADKASFVAGLQNLIDQLEEAEE